MGKFDRQHSSCEPQIGAVKSNQASEDTELFSISAAALSMYTMAHRLLRLM
jgi:hypothetical protein